jgi:hypothetical protein
MRAADSDGELDRRIYQMGEFGRINNVAKRQQTRCVADVVSDSCLNRCQEDWPAVLGSLPGFYA